MGYVGTVPEFEKQSNGVCAACVDDLLYDGTAQLTVESTFVCEIETTGYISGQTNFNISSFFPGYSRSSDGSYLDVVVYAETTPFPKKGFPYDVRLANNDGLEEVLRAVQAVDIQQDFQLLRLTTATGTHPKERYISFARLVSACNTDSDSIVVMKHPDDPDFTQRAFSDNGPYSIRVADRAVRISDSSEVNDGMSHQVLVLAEKVPFSVGYITTLLKPARRGDTTITVRPFEWWYDAASRKRSYPSQFPVTIRGAKGSFAGIEIARTVGYSVPSWKCDPWWYNSNDGCDCNCGILDPDCAYPSMSRFNGATVDSSVECLLNASKCETCPFCNISGRCTTNKSNDNGTVLPDEYDYSMVLTLSTPLRWDHSPGYAVESPIPVPADDNDPWIDAADDILDVYSWIEIKRFADTTEYRPSERARPHTPEMSDSPDPLNVEVAIFQVPDKLNFDEVKLCPVLGPNHGKSGIPPVFDTDGWDKWQVSDPMSIDNCSMTSFRGVEGARRAGCIKVKEHPKEQFNLFCIKGTSEHDWLAFDMPFARTSADELLRRPPECAFPPRNAPQRPVRLRHAHAREQQVAVEPVQRPQEPPRVPHRRQPRLPLHIRPGVCACVRACACACVRVCVGIIRRFTHDQGLNAVEDEFAQGAASGGDLSFDGRVYEFFGESVTKGEGLIPQSPAVPASVPYLSNRITFAVSQDAALDILASKAKDYPASEREVRELLGRFPPCVLEFDFDQFGGSTERQSVPLEPGKAYFMNAEVVFEPVYKVDLLQRQRIVGWNFRVLSTAVSSADLDWFSRQQAEVCRARGGRGVAGGCRAHASPLSKMPDPPCSRRDG